MKTTEIDSGAGIRSRLSNVVQIKVFHYCKIINIISVRQKSNFHAHVFFMSQGVQLAGPSTHVHSQVSWRASRPKESHA